jgi:hypothetical protein
LSALAARFSPEKVADLQAYFNTDHSVSLGNATDLTEGNAMVTKSIKQQLADDSASVGLQPDAPAILNQPFTD